jgi:hypothetical protein
LESDTRSMSVFSFRKSMESPTTIGNRALIYNKIPKTSVSLFFDTYPIPANGVVMDRKGRARVFGGGSTPAVSGYFN